MKGTVLVIADTHEPFCHPRYLNFCKKVRDKFKPDTIVHIGDEVDNHAISYHEHNPDGKSAKDEADLAEEKLHKWYKAFPKTYVCIGNHTALPYRRATTDGIPRRFLKNSFNEIWNAPKDWKWDFSWEFYGVKYEHGTGQAKYAHIQKAQINGQSTVIGHTHAHAGINYIASQKDLRFGMNVGCGIDIKAYAFEYGKNFNYRPCLGCGIIKEFGKRAEFIPMQLGRKK